MIVRILLYFVSLLCLIGCDSSVNQINPVPDYPVSLTINILRDAPDLMSQGNSISITKPQKNNQFIGFSGILIYHDYDDRFYAFDLCCPHEHLQDIRIEANMHIVTCPKCNSKFDISFGNMGYPISGPSKYPLKHYTVTRSGDFLRITK